MTTAAEVLRRRLGQRRPAAALVLGSGLGSLAEDVEDRVEVDYAELPGFPTGGVSGHAGRLIAGRLAGREVLMLSGRAHYYETGEPAAMRPAIRMLADLGVQTLILTNSAGSVREDIPPGSVMLIEDHINFSGLNPLIGETSEARFVSMTATYDPGLRRVMADAAVAVGARLYGGVYMWFSGPSFETPAEIRMARALGADAVGMSTVPEAILARFHGLKVLAASVITNYGAGMTGAELSHTETKEMAPQGGRTLAAVLKQALPELS